MFSGEKHSPQVGSSVRNQGGRHAAVLVGQSRSMRRLGGLIERVGRRHCTVLIRGESGTGKELVARHIHTASPRRAGPFIAVDCATLHESIVESQLFGHVRGAFTGADHPAVGFMRASDKGTLFLDEIGELPFRVQAKLLRCIQERAVVPLGGVAPIPVDMRIIAATHRDLCAMVRRGEFRDDLYHRLQVAELIVPPLRARREDIPLLAQHFLDLQAAMYDEPPKEFSPEVLASLEAFPWPGNVRQLANAIEHAYVFCPDKRIGPEYLRGHVGGVVDLAEDPGGGVIMPLATGERLLIERALRAAGGSQARAAELLGIERRKLYRRVRKYKLDYCTHSRRHSSSIGTGADRQPPPRP